MVIENLLLFILSILQTVEFNSKTVIGFKYSLQKYFQKILYRLDNRVNEEPAWTN